MRTAFISALCLTCSSTSPQFIISVISLPLAGRYLERVWGPLELVKFTVIVVVGSNAIAFGLAVIEFLIFRSEMFM